MKTILDAINEEIYNLLQKSNRLHWEEGYNPDNHSDQTKSVNHKLEVLRKQRETIETLIAMELE